jgi:FixJ family two-component response regulator
VADPDPAVRDGMRALLESSGLTVRCYDDAESLVGEPAESLPPCLVLDLELPGLSPPEWVGWIRALGPGTGVIAVASCPDPRLTLQLLGAGVLEVLEKPFPPQALVRWVEQVLSRPGLVGGAPGR